MLLKGFFPPTHTHTNKSKELYESPRASEVIMYFQTLFFKRVCVCVGACVHVCVRVCKSGWEQANLEDLTKQEKF